VIFTLWTKYAHYFCYKFYDINNCEDQKNVNRFDNSSAFYICLSDVKLPEDELKRTEMCQNVSGL